MGRREPDEYGAFELLDMALAGNTIAIRILRERIEEGSLTFEDLGLTEDEFQELEVEAHRQVCLRYIGEIRGMNVLRERDIVMLVWKHITEILEKYPGISWNELLLYAARRKEGDSE